MYWSRVSSVTGQGPNTYMELLKHKVFVFKKINKQRRETERWEDRTRDKDREKIINNGETERKLKENV
jgi:hypothetical protein